MKPLVPAEFTWCTFSPFDKIALGTLVRRAARPHCQMAEIGSWFGSGSTTVFLQELQEYVGSCLLCVDTWQGNPNVPRHQEIVSTFDVFGTFRANVSNAQSCVPVLELVSSSKAAARVVADKRFDLAFLDADHSYNSVREDIDFWRPKVRPGGILCGHDCEARMTPHLEQRIRDHLNVDSIAGDSPLFKEIHPGSILAVHEAFHGTASLFAEQTIVCPDGKIGSSSIWYAEVR